MLHLTPVSTQPGWPEGLADGDVCRAGSWNTALDAISREHFDALVIDLNDPAIVDTLRALQQAGRILAHVADGIAVVDFDLRVRWANPAFARWCGGSPVGRGFYEAVGSSGGEGDEFCPFHSALTQGEADGCVTARLQTRDNRHLDVLISPLEVTDAGPLFVALCHDSTSLVQKQQKLDALHRAGRELSAVGGADVAALDVAGRIELLKGNIRRLTRDLLHYELIEVRLLESETGKLVPLLQDGLTTEAAGRELYARPEGNGVTGFVAATGKGYLCPDTRADPLYLQGASGRGRRSRCRYSTATGSSARSTSRASTPDAFPRGLTSSSRRSSATPSRRRCRRSTCLAPRRLPGPASRSTRSTGRWRCRWTTSWPTRRRCWSGTSATPRRSRSESRRCWPTPGGSSRASSRSARTSARRRAASPSSASRRRR
ncbi:MAG: PAS domain-containing protein [Gemmataceae bacterium]